MNESETGESIEKLREVVFFLFVPSHSFFFKLLMYQATITLFYYTFFFMFSLFSLSFLAFFYTVPSLVINNQDVLFLVTSIAFLLRPFLDMFFGIGSCFFSCLQCAEWG